MKVVHISNSDNQGGAAIAVSRLHHGLSKHGVDSTMLVGEQGSPDDSIFRLEDKSNRGVSPDLETSIRDRYLEDNRTDASNTYFSLCLNGRDAWQHPQVETADIIHLHWIGSLLTPRDVGRILRLGKPVFWTSHDFNPFSGGCHFPAGCTAFKDSCGPCQQLISDSFRVPEAVLRDKELLWKLDNLTLICPSEWMANMVGQSRLFRKAPRCLTIPNGIDTNTFAVIPKMEARKSLAIDPSLVLFMVAADFGSEKRKGFREASEALRLSHSQLGTDSSKIGVVHVGNCQANLKETVFPVIDLGYIESEEQMAMAYSACDLAVVPSLEDNLPNVAMEAAICGLPVCGFEIGGMPELVQHGETGFLAPLFNCEKLGESIVTLTRDADLRSRMSIEAARRARDKFDLWQVSARMIEEYHKALADQNFSEEIVDPETTPGPCLAQMLPELATRLSDHVSEERLRVIEELTTEVEMLREECKKRLEIIERYDPKPKLFRRWPRL